MDKDNSLTVTVTARRTKLVRVDLSSSYEPPFGWSIIDYKVCHIAAAAGGTSHFNECRESRYAMVLIEQFSN